MNERVTKHSQQKAVRADKILTLKIVGNPVAEFTPCANGLKHRIERGQAAISGLKQEASGRGAVGTHKGSSARNMHVSGRASYQQKRVVCDQCPGKQFMVSVVIPTYNAEQYIDGLLKSLTEQTIHPEIVVIDSSSSDRTVQIAESYNAKVLQIRKEDFNHGGTRNLGAEQTIGDLVVFLTQDAVPSDPDCIGNLTRVLEDPGIAASYARQIPRDEATPTEKFARHFNYPEKSLLKSWNDIPELGIKTFFFSNVCSAVRKIEFKKLGGFPEKLIMFEDMLFAANLLRDGHKIAYVPDARVIHSHNYNWLQQFRRYEMAGISFSENPQFLEYASGRNEGVNFLREEIRFLLKRKMYYWGAYAFIEAMFKFTGYNLGLKHGRLPTILRNRVLRSLND